MVSEEVVNQVAWALHCWSCPLCWNNGFDAMAHSDQDHVTKSDRLQAGFLVAALGLVPIDDTPVESELMSVAQSPAHLALDLWMALGFDSQEFTIYYQEHGFGDTWAALLDVVRGPKTPCAEPLDGDDWCVFREGHDGPHYGADDVGPPNELLVKYWQLNS